MNSEIRVRCLPEISSLGSAKWTISSTRFPRNNFALTTSISSSRSSHRIVSTALLVTTVPAPAVSALNPATACGKGVFSKFCLLCVRNQPKSTISLQALSLAFSFVEFAPVISFLSGHSSSLVFLGCGLIFATSEEEND